MPDVSYTPKRQNALPIVMISCAAVVAVVCLVFMMIGIGNQMVFQLTFLAAAVFMVFFFTRFLSVSYTYTLNYTDHLFLVTQKVGRRLTVLCRLEMTAMYRVRPYTAEDDLEKRRTDRYSYCVNLRPESSYLVFFNDGEHVVSVRLELDDTFFRLFSRIAEDNAARMREDEEITEAYEDTETDGPVEPYDDTEPDAPFQPYED